MESEALIMENKIPKDEYFAKQLDETLDNIYEVVKAEKNNVAIVGKVYEFREVEKNNAVSFKLNYYKDQFINVYISEDKWNEIKKFKAVAENKIIKVIGSLQFWKNTREGVFRLNAFKVFKVEVDVPNDVKFKDKLATIVIDINKKIKTINEKTKLYGRIYGVKKTTDHGLRFMLNYYRDRSIGVYISEKNLGRISHFADIKENKVVKIEGILNIYGMQEYVLNFIASGVYENLSDDSDAEELHDKPLKEIKPIHIDFKIALISSENGNGKNDFIAKLKDKNLNTRIVEDIPVPLVGSKALELIPEAIKRANDNPEVNVICIVRGGGDKAVIDYVFNNTEICAAIRNSRKAVLIAVGNTVNVTGADMVSDAPVVNGKRSYFKTPSELAEFLIRDVYKAYSDLKMDKSAKIVKAKKEDTIKAWQEEVAVNAAKQQEATSLLDNSKTDEKIVKHETEDEKQDDKSTGFNYMYLIGIVVILLLLYMAFLK